MDDYTVAYGVDVAADGSETIACATRHADGTMHVDVVQLTDSTREAIDVAVGGVLFNASNFPAGAVPYVLGQNMGPLRDLIVERVVAALEGSTDSPCEHDSWTGDEGPITELGRWPVRWRCDGCGVIRHDPEPTDSETGDTRG